MGRHRKKPIDPEAMAVAADVEDKLPFNESLPYIHPDLVATLEKCPHINCVWMDEQGTWYFCEKPGFTAYSREDILNG